MSAKLTIKSRGRVWTVDLSRESVVAVGRSNNATIQILDTGVSGIHFELRQVPGGWIMRDLESTNGTLVNGKKTDVSLMSDGDTIAAGSCTIAFSASPNLGASENLAPTTDVGDLAVTPELELADEYLPDEIEAESDTEVS